MRVADKPTLEPILRCFYNQGKSQMLPHLELSKKVKKKKPKTKARQALDKSRKFVKTTIYRHRVVYTTQMKARTNNYSEKILLTWTTRLKNKQGEDIQAKKT